MKAKVAGNWHVDLNNLTCLNTETEMVITFVKRGPMLVGTLKYIPVELAKKWITDPNKEENLRKMIIEAEDVFFQAYFAKD